MKVSMIRMIKIECHKALRNKFFIIALGIGLLFALLSAWYKIDSYFYFSTSNAVNTVTENPMNGSRSLYNHWIGGDVFSLGFTLFFTMLPLLATLPYGWSYFQEKKSGYVAACVLRVGKHKYYLAKYIATFISGGVVIIVPLMINFLVVAMFVPAIKPSMINAMYYTVGHNSMWSSLFYTYPLLFVLGYLVIDFIFAGLFATMSTMLSFWVKNRVAIMLIPYFLILALHYSRGFLAYKFYYEISPLYFLHSTCVSNHANGLIILMEGVFLFIVTFGTVYGIGRKHDII